MHDWASKNVTDDVETSTSLMHRQALSWISIQTGWRLSGSWKSIKSSRRFSRHFARRKQAKNFALAEHQTDE
jgi:hypothetical protein